ncbi:MAG: hypothetical protein ISS79_07180 [Phycisphaerae bacterium]|nr:hypothetical protein [Phycisphaerae bacterium]
MGSKSFFTIVVLLIGLSSAVGEDWPQFHGSRRDNRSAETGLLEQWSEGGLELAWRVEGLGHGFASVAIVDGFLYEQADGNHKDRHLACLEAATGKTMWIASELAGRASATLTFAEGRVCESSKASRFLAY